MDTKTKVVAAVWFFQVANYLDRVAMSFAGPSMMKSLSMEPSTFRTPAIKLAGSWFDRTVSVWPAMGV